MISGITSENIQTQGQSEAEASANMAWTPALTYFKDTSTMLLLLSNKKNWHARREGCLKVNII